MLIDNISSDSDSNSDNGSDNDSYIFLLYTHALTFTLASTLDHNQLAVLRRRSLSRARVCAR